MLLELRLFLLLMIEQRIMIELSIDCHSSNYLSTLGEYKPHTTTSRGPTLPAILNFAARVLPLHSAIAVASPLQLARNNLK